jgi:hypothetical protein
MSLFKQAFCSLSLIRKHLRPKSTKVVAHSLDGEKLYLKGSVPSEVVANRVWDVIKPADAT